MPAPYRKKDSILEMSDREREARRLAELARPGRDALEGVYPEMFVNPASIGRTAVNAAKNIAAKIFSRTPREIPSVEIGSRVQPTMEEWLQNLRKNEHKNTSEYEWNIIKNHALATHKRQQAEKLKQSRALEKAVAREQFHDAVDKAIIRGHQRGGAEILSRGFGPQNENERDSTKYKKGGAVKASRYRGDGIAQRGKTRGRMI